MGQVSAAIKVRLSKAQMTLIWPGLDFIACAYLTRVRTGRCRYAYPFQIYPLPQGVDTGGFSNKMIDAVIALSRRLQPKAKTGGRVQMDTIEIRAAILSCRLNLQHQRRQAYDARRWDAKTKRRFRLDRAAITELETATKRVIKTLERLMKRANRRFLRVNPWEFEACSKEWRWHLRWIRFHLAYFNPPSILKRFYQAMIDRLVALAESGIRYFNRLPPEPPELRRIIRRFVRSARRGRISPFIWGELMKPKPGWDAQLSLVEFVDKRADLEKVPQP